jgi:hypothetical protein
MRFAVTLFLALALTPFCLGASAPEVDLSPSLHPSAMISAGAEGVLISGTTNQPAGADIRVRVTTSAGSSHEAKVRVEAGRFSVRFPADFHPAATLSPSVLYVDATSASEFGGPQAKTKQSEITLLVSVGGIRPELPLVFTDDFVDRADRKDLESAQWSRNRALANLFMRSRGAAMMRIQKPTFDLADSTDWRWFKESATLYDFAHRDRAWSAPLGGRVAAGFWNAVWPRWFNPSNDHPWDGDAKNTHQDNFRPYSFTNDLADLLVLYRLNGPGSPGLVDGATRNLLALQYRDPGNFALKEASGRQETYTAGAFRYGMFNSGEWMTEGKGWFANPQFRDFAHGGVLNGRAVWALGESLKAAPKSALAPQQREAISLAAKFCLHDAVPLKYAYRSPSGKVVWSRTDGEHAYLLMGLLAAYQADPEMKLQLGAGEAVALRDVCADGLDGLADIAGADGTWTRYGNSNAVNIIALADGARILKGHARSIAWRAAAVRAADKWLSLRFRPEEGREGSPLFSTRASPGGDMTCVLGKSGAFRVSLYMNGHWLHALAAMHALTGEARYKDRGDRLLGYFCGDNPLHIRLLNELGAVCNNVSDSDGSGRDDLISWTGYPESTAFVQIGLLHWLDAR